MPTVTFTTEQDSLTGEKTGVFKASDTGAQTYQAKNPGTNIQGSNINLSPEQLAQYGYINPEEGETPEQAVRREEMRQSIDQHFEGMEGDVDQEYTPQLTEAQQTRLNDQNARARALGKPEMSADEYAHHQASLSASKQALAGDPDSAEVLPSHYQAEAIDPDHGFALDEMRERFNSSEVGTMFDMLEGREVNPDAVAAIVRNYGLRDDNALQTNMNVAFEVGERALDAYLSDRGQDAEAFKDWVRDNYPAEAVNDMVRNQFTKGDPRVWSEMVSEYSTQSALAHPDHAMAALQKAGIPAQQIGGQVVVTLNGMQMTLADAFKQGLLNARWS